MENLKNWLNRLNNSEINTIPKRDKRQIGLMMVIFVMILAGNWAYKTLKNPIETITPGPETARKLAILDSLYAKSAEADTLSRLDQYIIKRYDTIKLFSFDPNKASRNELLLLGLTEKQARNLIQYRENGGKFKTPDDVRKLYGMRTMQYRILKPFITIKPASVAENRISPSSSAPEKKEKTPPQGLDTELFEFDPNTISANDMQRLGFSAKQVEAFMSDRKKGKKFFVADDFKKVFFVTDRKFAELKPYISIDMAHATESGLVIDLNTCSANDLINKGMSAEEAQKTLEFREKVGYFFAPWQLSDCIDKGRAKFLKSKFYTCASVELRTIDVNNAGADILMRHPYISQMNAQCIMEARAEKAIQSMAELQEICALSQWEAIRLKNYVKF